MCRKFNDIWYTTKFKGYTVADYQENVAPVMTPEKKLLYQVFCVLETHCEKGRGQPPTEYVLSAKKDLSIDLKRQVLENAMKAPPPTDVDDILASLSQTYQESVAKVQTMQPSEETGNEEDDVDEDEIAAAEAQSSKKEKVGKKAYTSSWAKTHTPWERPS